MKYVNNPNAMELFIKSVTVLVYRTVHEKYGEFDNFYTGEIKYGDHIRTRDGKALLMDTGKYFINKLPISVQEMADSIVLHMNMQTKHKLKNFYFGFDKLEVIRGTDMDFLWGNEPHLRGMMVWKFEIDEEASKEQERQERIDGYNHSKFSKRKRHQ